METELSKLLSPSLEWERIPAVDGLSLSQHDIETLVDSGLRDKSQAQLSPPELGCFLSHRNAWQRIADSDDEYGIVLEDDVVLSQYFGQLLSNCLWLPDNTALLRLDTNTKPVRLTRCHATTAVDKITFNVSEFRGNHVSSAAYLLQRDLACWLVSRYCRVGTKTVDVELWRDDLFGDRGLKFANQWVRLHLVPAVAVQQCWHETRILPSDAEHSTIAPKKERIPLVQKTLRELARPFNMNHWKRQTHYLRFRRSVAFIE